MVIEWLFNTCHCREPDYWTDIQRDLLDHAALSARYSFLQSGGRIFRWSSFPSQATNWVGFPSTGLRVLSFDILNKG